MSSPLPHSETNGHHPQPRQNGHCAHAHPIDPPCVNGHPHTNGRSTVSPHSSLLLPSDWPPLTGAIDLELHDRAHASSKTEWWYFNAHVHSAASASSPSSEYSFFVAFFRMAVGDNPDGSFQYSHSITWALVDVSRKSYQSHASLDWKTPEALIPIVEDNTWQMDGRLNDAMLEVLKKNRVPLPDRMFDGPCSVADEHGGMHLQYGGNSLVKEKDGYHLHLVDEDKDLSVDVLLRPHKAVQRQAHDGVVKVGVKDEWMFYYFIPRMAVEGSLTLQGQQLSVTGDGWYDHEFGGDLQSARTGVKAAVDEEQHRNVDELRAIKQTSVLSSMQDAKTKPNHAWNWLSLQFDNDTELTATYLVNTTTNQVVDNYAIIIHPDSSQSEHSMQLTPLSTWISLATTNDYPSAWSLTFPGADLTVSSVFAQQEFITLISRPAFYEGRVNVEGELNGQRVKGRGFVERFGFNQMTTLDTFFRRMSSIVMKALDNYFPHHPSPDRVADLVTRIDRPEPYKDFAHLMTGVNEELFYETLVKPIRLIADRGGKSWRSYACLVCVDVVGGSSERFRKWLAMPEIMHVGSLIIDDIQDKSLTRRGGPACHVVFGDAIAINAGNYAYFLSPRCLTEAVEPPLSAEQKMRLIDMYFFTMRTGHLGQAFDITGMDYMMQDIVLHGDVHGLLAERVACTHRMKSAVPAGGLARMGSFVGGGTDEQSTLLGMYFEAVGLAFQIVDDILNLTGFQGDTKLRGEDVMAGKVTFPIAMAMRVGAEGGKEWRREIWDLVNMHTEDPALVARCVSLVEQSGGIAASYEYADELVTKAWAELDLVLPDSYYKLMLRAFGFYVLQRHY